MKPSFTAPSWRSRVEAVSLLAVIALLGALAVIQSRWLGAIAEAERRKLTEEANEKATGIAQDIDRELTRAFLELRIDATMLEGKESPAFSEQLERFRVESPHAALVKEVLVAQQGEGVRARLLRFDAASQAFVAEPWPATLERVKAVIEGASDTLPVSLPLALSLPPVLADVPALVSPIINVIIGEKAGGGGQTSRLTQIRQTFMSHTTRGPIEILLLDPRYLREALVGRVASSRLGPDGPFAWSVVRSADDSPVAGTGFADKSRPDATAPLLRLRFDDLDRSLLRGFLPGLPDAVKDSSVRFVVQMASPSIVRGGGPSPTTAPWTLQIRHREGSIDAAVQAQQRRNTALSASILGVLGLSAGLVFFSARRLRAIATQQVEFVAAVSHELRTPLAVIRSAADNLADGVIQDNRQAQRYGALIRDESVRLTDMVEHVLEFAGADSPGRAARGPVDVVEAARAAVKGMEALAVERGAAVAVDVVAADEPLRVNGDLSHLTRAISNLVGNALKYGGDAPHVTVSVRRSADGVEVTVADQGDGLEPAEIPRLFEPFYRGQRASEAHVPGSGLGLALVRRIVLSHGGRASASNAPHGGARFTIALPAA